MNVKTDTPAPSITDAASACANSATECQNYVRQHPAGALLIAAGLGLAVVVVARALTPPPSPRNRAMQLLEDIQDRLAELAQPAHDRASSLAEGGAGALSRGVDSIGDLHLDRKLGKLSRWLKNLAH